MYYTIGHLNDRRDELLKENTLMADAIDHLAQPQLPPGKMGQAANKPTTLAEKLHAAGERAKTQYAQDAHNNNNKPRNRGERE